MRIYGREKTELQRGLEARHIELIALGGIIGVGLFMDATSTLKWAGSSVLLAYIITRLFIFFIMRLMGGDALSGIRHWLLCRVRSPVYESFFGYLTAW